MNLTARSTLRLPSVIWSSSFLVSVAMHHILNPPHRSQARTPITVLLPRCYYLTQTAMHMPLPVRATPFCKSNNDFALACVQEKHCLAAALVVNVLSVMQTNLIWQQLQTLAKTLSALKRALPYASKRCLTRTYQPTLNCIMHRSLRHLPRQALVFAECSRQLHKI